jgi:adenylylsulfate kinase
LWARRCLQSLSRPDQGSTKMTKKILIMGLSGAGKTTLAKLLVPRLSAVHLNADEIRAHVHKDLGFELKDRIEHARRLGWLCDEIVKSGAYVIADFICPTAETRAVFGEAFIVWVDRIKAGRFEDTNRIFEPPTRYDIRVTPEGTPEYWAEQVASAIRPVFGPQRPTALFIGRYQPFHAGHQALIEEGLRRVGQVCIAVRDTANTDEKNPYPFEYVRARIEEALRAHAGKFVVLPLPNITAVFYGRDVGYLVEKIELSNELTSITATDLRRRLRKFG